MRITTNMMFDRSLGNITSSTSRLDKAYQQMQTGDKFSTAGEDPNGMSQKMGLNDQIEQLKQYSTNGTMLNANLSLQETVMGSLNTSLDSAYTKIQQSVNGTLSDSDRSSIADELEQLQKQMLDLMNTKNSNGEYIFSGNQTNTIPFVQDSSGNYSFQGDAGQRYIQVSQSVSIAANDSGLGLFQTVPVPRSATATSANLTVGISDQGSFNTFYSSKYDPSTAANNVYTISTVAGTPDTYQITDAGGNVLQNGNYTQGDAITFNGLSLTMSVAAGGTNQTFSLDTPKNDNVLNSLNSMITALRDPTTSSDTLSALASKTESHIKNTQDSINVNLGQVGGRLTSLDNILASNDSVSTLSQTTMANVSQIDVYEAISNVTKEDTALSMAQKAYSMINKSNLFSYM